MLRMLPSRITLPAHRPEPLAGILVSPVIDETGLRIGAGTRLARLSRNGGLALDADKDRLAALLSVAAGRPVAADEFSAPLAAASRYWQRGDRALANLRLVFAALPRLASSTDVANVRDAADLIDGGLPPRELMKALGFDTSAFAASALDKFDPGQPRVPAGSGRTSGQWTDGTGGGTGEAGRLVDGRSAGDDGANTRPTSSYPSRNVSIIPVVSGPLVPGGQIATPHIGPPPLDPAHLNKPLSPEEQQTIIDTLNAILMNKPEDARRLKGHPYRNLAHLDTGARLPASPSGYLTYYVRAPGTPPGEARVLIGGSDLIFYTNNHYKSSYQVHIR